MTFVAPKGIEQGGAVQFKIKADVEIPESVNVRAGYSANAIMSIGQKEIFYVSMNPYYSLIELQINLLLRY